MNLTGTIAPALGKRSIAAIILVAKRTNARRGRENCGSSMKRSRENIACALLLVLCAFVPARPDGVDDYIHVRMRGMHIPGLSLAVVRSGQILKASGYGAANLELNSPATPQTVYEIGSMRSSSRQLP